MNPKILVALAAGTGGIAPNLVHVGQGMIKELPNALPGPMFLGGMAIFFVLGALVAIFFSEENSKKAFVLGIGLPALIATAQNHPGSKVGLLDLVPTAYAQPAPAASVPAAGSASSPAAAAQWELAFKSAFAKDCKGCELWFADGSGKVFSKNIIDPPSPSAKAWTIPTDAKTFAIVDPQSNTRFVAIPSTGSGILKVGFERKYSAWNDFRRGLGAFDMKSYEQMVEVTEAK